MADTTATRPTRGDVIVCSPATYLLRLTLDCPTCVGKTDHVGADALWYGLTVTCCSCGDSWTEGELHPRPFQRGWRKAAVDAALRRWNAAVGGSREGWRAWLNEQARQGDVAGEVSR